MLKTAKRWWYYWNLSKQIKQNLQKQIEVTKRLGPATPPTPEEVEQFKKDLDMGWNDHMIQRIERRKTYYEASIN